MRLQRYIFWIILRSFLLTLLLVTGTVFLVGTLQSFQRYDELSLSLLLSRLPYLVPFAMTLAIPLSLLIGTLLAYGRLSADNEILALRMGGIHPLRAVSPALALGMAATVLTIWLNSTVSPLANAKALQVTRDDLRNFLESLEERRLTEFESDRVGMKWREAGPDGSLVDVAFRLFPEDSPRVYGSAARARISRDESLDRILFRFEDLRMTRGDAQEAEVIAEIEIAYPVDSLFSSGGRQLRRNCLTSEELLLHLNREPLLGIDPGEETLRGYRTEYSARISLAVACLVFALAGAPIGMLFRHGSFLGAGFLAILLAFVVYYPLHEVGWQLSYTGTWPSGLAMAIPGSVVGAVGIALLVRAVRR